MGGNLNQPVGGMGVLSFLFKVYTLKLEQTSGEMGLVSLSRG